MHRIDTKTAQKDKFGAGKNGFTRGNPQTGTPATDLDDDYFDMLQEELCSVVEASGTSLEKGRHDQLLTALRALLLSRKNPFGDIKSDGTVQTALENLGLRASGQYTDNLLFTGPDGLKIQVFRRTLANLTTVGVVNSVPVTFPVPFPVNCWGVFSTKLTWVQITNSCEWVSNTGFTAQVMMNIAVNTNTSDAMFLAIGY
ncbi:gp53-like domain-containing protein [Escherichia coli]|uniref:gp53-like domain-containing protein n=1 Tax=Escherichia coli TaxID=562 RepID=UPI00102044C8